MKKITAYLTAMILLAQLFSCREVDPPEPGYINITFEEIADGLPLVFDTAKYTNEAGNEYMVTEVQYFISNLELYYRDGQKYKVQNSQGIHYRDSDIPETKKWIITEAIPAGIIDTIVFTFGLDEETNKSGLFTDHPESSMFWPDELGGGYHYMKLNGKWRDTQMMLNPFNFHLGIGQTYDTTGQVTAFIQNYFKVKVYLPVYSSYLILVNPDLTAELALSMNIESWYKTPHTWDFNTMGGMMMQNQQALQAACENGYDVFTIGPYHEW